MTSKVAQKQKKRKEKIKDYIFRYLQGQSCLDCGEKDICTLQFDHVKGEKKYNVSHMYKNVSSLETVKKEIEKCDVVCANCHAKRTASQFEWYKKRSSNIIKTSYIVYPHFKEFKI